MMALAKLLAFLALMLLSMAGIGILFIIVMEPRMAESLDTHFAWLPLSALVVVWSMWCSDRVLGRRR